MDSDTATVVGISPGDFQGRGYAFVPVIAVVEDNLAIAIPDPKTAFPNLGNVYVAEDNWLPGRDVAGVWHVRRSREAEEGERSAEFSAEGRGHSRIFEILEVAVPSSQPEQLREVLTTGLRISFPAPSHLLLRLSDGPVVGPIRPEPSGVSGNHTLVCRSESFVDLLSRWESIDQLKPFTFRGQRIARTFSSYLALPVATARLDCATLTEAIRLVLKARKVLADGVPGLTKAQIGALATSVGDLGDPERVRLRVQRVEEALKVAASAGAQMDDLTAFLLEQEAVKAQLERVRVIEGMAERKRVRDEEAEAFVQVEALREEAKSVEASIAAGKLAVQAAEQDIARAADRVVQRIHERLVKAQEAPAELLSEVALLRPFLTQAPLVVSQRATLDRAGLSVLRIDPPVPAKPVTSVVALVKSVEDALAGSGLTRSGAQCMAREVAAAVLAGQWSLFAGSLARALVRSVAHAVGGGHCYWIRIPVGLFDSASFEQAVNEVHQGGAGKGIVQVIVLEGANLSAVEAYASVLTSSISARVLRGDITEPPFIIFGTLAHGPAGLPLDESTCSYGPVFDTDLLSLASSRATGVQPSGSIAIEALSQWATSIRAGVTSPELVTELTKAIARSRNVLWEAVVALSYSALSAFSAGSVTPAQSLVYGWYLNRAVVRGKADQRFIDMLEGGKVDGATEDPRLSRWLARHAPDGTANEV